jgi:hypothetical protein
LDRGPGQGQDKREAQRQITAPGIMKLLNNFHDGSIELIASKYVPRLERHSQHHSYLAR